MKIAVTTSVPDIEGEVDPRFGRCPYFLLVESEDLSYEAIANPNVALGGGAGIQSAQLMAERGVKVVLTGQCGPNAHRTLSAAGIGVVTGCSGLVRDVIHEFKSGALKAIAEPNTGHVGVTSSGNTSTMDDPTYPGQGGSIRMQPGSGMGMGRGKGGGMGIGRGGGRGLGRGGGRGAGSYPRIDDTVSGRNLPPAAQADNKDELAGLKRQAGDLTRLIHQIQRRIDALEQSPMRKGRAHGG
jgi:predicted Fe-Mo cluster-binding NifX family protein